MAMKLFFSISVLTSSILIAQVSFADTIINNNNSNQAPSTAQNPCNVPNTSQGLPPGTYTTRNGDGTSDTIYTTGDKQLIM